MDDWAEHAIEEACRLAQRWYCKLPHFPTRVNLGTVAGFKYPAILSEHDCVMHFARFLREAGVEWESIHNQVSQSRWLFDKPHLAALAVPKWRVDLALLKSEEFQAACLPAKEAGFRFDAFLEFGYLSDFYAIQGCETYNEPDRFHKKVDEDVKKIGRYIANGVCRAGYVIVFEDRDSGFPSTFIAEAEAQHACRVRFIRGEE